MYAMDWAQKEEDNMKKKTFDDILADASLLMH